MREKFPKLPVTRFTRALLVISVLPTCEPSRELSNRLGALPIAVYSSAYDPLTWTLPPTHHAQDAHQMSPPIATLQDPYLSSSLCSPLFRTPSC